MRSRAGYAVIALLVSLGVTINVAFAQAAVEGLNPVWVEDDLKSVKFILGLIPIERHGIKDLEKRFREFPPKNASWIDETNLGFGGERVKLSMGVGYTTLYIDYLLFNGRIVHYKLGARVSGGKWDAYGKTIERAWREPGGPEYKIDQGELVSTKEFPESWQAYRANIGKHVGIIQNTNVPPELPDHYERLTDRFENSRITTVGCDRGKTAIDALENAKRVDLIENVLRGYNPGGRVYAAISLLRMQKRGLKLKPDTIWTIGQISKSNAEMATCWADMVETGLLAKDVILEYVRSEDW